MTLTNEHWDATGKCDCPMDGVCCECGKPCNDHDLIGNQTELGFPKYWCTECINKAFDEDTAKYHLDDPKRTDAFAHEGCHCPPETSVLDGLFCSQCGKDVNSRK